MNWDFIIILFNINLYIYFVLQSFENNLAAVMIKINWNVYDTIKIICWRFDFVGSSYHNAKKSTGYEITLHRNTHTRTHLGMLQVTLIEYELNTSLCWIGRSNIIQFSYILCLHCVCVCIQGMRRWWREEDWTIELEFVRRCLSDENSQRP